MSGPLPMSDQPTLWDSCNATSSPASADGPTRSDSPTGTTIDLFGRVVVPVNPSQPLARAKVAADDRHLWPHWARLIQSVALSAIFGEQVTSSDCPRLA